MAPKNDTKTYYIIKNIFILFVIILIVGSLLFKEFLFKYESLAVWICFFIVFGYLLKTGGHQRVESPAQLLFYDDYLIFLYQNIISSSEKTNLKFKKYFIRT